MSWRRFFFRAGRFGQVWCIRRDDEALLYEVWFGRSATTGQKRVKHFESTFDLNNAYHRIIDQKLNKGYVEVTTDMQRTERVTVQETSTARVVVVDNDELEAPNREIVFE